MKNLRRRVDRNLLVLSKPIALGIRNVNLLDLIRIVAILNILVNRAVSRIADLKLRSEEAEVVEILFGQRGRVDTEVLHKSHALLFEEENLSDVTEVRK